MCTQRPETHNAHIFSVIGDGRKILEHWNTQIAILIWATRPSSAPRCHRGRVASVSAAALSLHLLKNCSSECSSVPVRRRARRIRLETCANELSAISGFASWNTRRHSECSSLFQRSSRGSGRAVSEGGGHWARRPAGSNRTGAGIDELIGATAEGWGGPGGAAPAAGTVGCSSVPFRSRLFQCARIGFGGKEAALDPGSSTDRRAIGFRVDCGTGRQSPAGGRAAGRWEGRGLAHSLVST